MRVEIHLPDNKEFLQAIQELAKAENRSRKNWIETVIIKLVNDSQKTKQPTTFSPHR
jgi:hypothetical protein